jgi:predicted phage terminase large subunit-like protein
LWGYNQGRELYLLAQIRGKWEFPTLVARFLSFTRAAFNFSKTISPSRIYIEDKASGISLVQTLARQDLNVIAWKPKNYQFPDDKIGRANEAALIISTGVVYIPANEPWTNDFITEHSEFTDDKNLPGHDDQVDTTTMSISVWRKMGGGRAQLGANR